MSKSPKRVLVTAALPYSNGRPHVGHIAGAYLPSDTYVRYLRSKGVPVLFVCGSDDYGVAIMLTAEKENRTPREVAAYYNEKQRKAFAGLNISFDIFSGTSTCPYHTKATQDFFKSVNDKGYFAKEASEQFYDPEKQVFLPDRFVKGTCGYCDTPDQNGDQCENCGKTLDTETLKNPISVFSGTPATKKSTVHWFIDLKQFEASVRNWLESAELRDHTRSYVKGLLSSGLVRRAMTRDISWGIPVPLEEPDAKGKVIYVWFDAPIGYISDSMEACQAKFGDWRKFSEWWQSDDCDIYHFIGEDNTIFHCVIWIAMLTAEASFKLPKGVIVNQYLNIQFPGEEAQKISKSRGKAVWIEDYLDEGGNPDSLRYYLTMISPERARTVYSPEDLIQRHNSELANVIGNFVHRIVSFTRKNFGPEIPAYLSEKVTQRDREFLAEMERTLSDISSKLDSFLFKDALERLMEFGRECNRYVDEKAPWTARKTDPEAAKVTLYYALAAIRFLSVTLAPFMPSTAQKISKILGISEEMQAWSSAITPLNAGHTLNEPEILFQKIETEKSA